MKRLLRIAAPVLIVPAMLLALVLLPVVLPVVAWQTARDRRRRMAAAFATGCSVCGARLGAVALDLADGAWAACVAALHAAHPHAHSAWSVGCTRFAMAAARNTSGARRPGFSRDTKTPYPFRTHR